MTQLEFIIRLGVAFLLGPALGLERQWRATHGWFANQYFGGNGGGSFCHALSADARRFQPHSGGGAGGIWHWHCTIKR